MKNVLLETAMEQIVDNNIEIEIYIYMYINNVFYVYYITI